MTALSTYAETLSALQALGVLNEGATFEEAEDALERLEGEEVRHEQQ